MHLPFSVIRVIFLILCTLSGCFYSLSAPWFNDSWLHLSFGGLIGIGGGLALLALDPLLKKIRLKALNTLILGLFVSYFLAGSILLILSPAMSLFFFPPLELIIVMACAYIGITVTARAADEFSISIPFVRFQPGKNKKRDVLTDVSVLMDARIIDLAASGLLDHHLVIPRHLVKELHAQAESDDDPSKGRARRCLEVIRKLEAIPTLGLRYTDTNFPEIKDSMTRLIRIARFLEANILTADISRIQQSDIEGIQVINIHSLSNALKPLMQTGEAIEIKVQRYGKEHRQGVGYLEDGTMVVVNGGGDYIGETTKAQVLSVKHTSSGRMIFCNVIEEGEVIPDLKIEKPATQRQYNNSSKDYSAV